MPMRGRILSATVKPLRQEQKRLEQTWLRPPGPGRGRGEKAFWASRCAANKILWPCCARPQMDYDALMQIPAAGPGVADPRVREQLVIEARYAGYLKASG